MRPTCKRRPTVSIRQYRTFRTPTTRRKSRSVLRLSYVADVEEKALVDRRLEALEAKIRAAGLGGLGVEERKEFQNLIERRAGRKTVS